MLTSTRIRRLSVATVSAMLLLGVTLINVVHAQMPSAPATSAVLPRPTVLSLQEALNRQGAVIKVDGVLGNETRAAIRQFQSQHHLPVTGEPDRATLDKLGVLDRSGTAQAAMAGRHAGMPGQAHPQAGGMQGGMMHSGMMGGEMMKHHEMMRTQMQSMMSMMQDMMKRMEAMQSQMQMHPKSN
jgi:peptidoglycan hydrolase-like protein with peptidoglycan-binding domain